MLAEELKLTVYLGERDHVGGRLLADALMDVYARHELARSLLLRGVEGFGLKHTLQSERLLTLSEDLPILALAVDRASRIDAALADVRELSGEGLITLERARRLDGTALEAGALGVHGPAKLTVYVGRQERAGGRPAHVAVVDCLHRHGLEGASVLLGLDGTAHGERRRARLLAGNREVPMMILSVGDAAAIARAVPELAAMLERPSMTLERVRVCKRDGVLLAEPHRPPIATGSGRSYWQKLVVYTSERARHGRQPLYGALVRRLRSEGAAGATALRGCWGYHGDHAPHGERFWSLQRHVPVLTILLDTPENMQRWFAIVDEMTAETGLVTSELVPALRAVGPDVERGGLALAEPREA